MKKLILSLAAAAGLFLVPAVQDRAPAPPEVGDDVPAFRLNDHTGTGVRVAAPEEGEEGPWTILAFFPKAATPG